MLYATTRGKHDVVTAYKTIHTDCYSDGGLFVPFRMPQIKIEQFEAMMVLSPEQIVAEVLNLFFSTKLTSWDIEYALGRSPLKAGGIGRRLLVAELWHNAGLDISWASQRISDRIRGDEKHEKPSNWLQIVVRIALLIASYGNLLASGALKPHRVFDVAVTTGDFAMPMAVWYARRMGLPIGNIVCGCNANGGVWDLLNRGEFATGDVLSHTLTPEADVVVPRNLERLVLGTLGWEETLRYLHCCEKRRSFILSEEQLRRLGDGLFAAVISDSRVKSIIPGVYHTSGHILGPYTALAYGSLQDYRSMTGHTRTALLIEERSPKRDAELVGSLLKMHDLDQHKKID